MATTFKDGSTTEVVQTVRKTTVYNIRQIAIAAPSEGNAGISIRIYKGTRVETLEAGEVVDTSYVWDSESFPYSMESDELAALLSTNAGFAQAWAGFAQAIEDYAVAMDWIPSGAVAE